MILFLIFSSKKNGEDYEKEYFARINALLKRIVISSITQRKFSTADLELTKEDRGYDVIRMDELLITNERSLPELPIKFVNLIIPCGMEVDDISITTQQEDIDGSFTINPSPGPMINTDPPSPAEPDQVIYGSSNKYPNECVEVLSHGYFDGANRIVTLAVYPVQFIPDINTLIFNSNIDFTLSFTGSESPDATPLFRLAKYDDFYKNINDISKGGYFYCLPPILTDFLSLQNNLNNNGWLRKLKSGKFYADRMEGRED